MVTIQMTKESASVASFECAAAAGYAQMIVV